MADDNELVANEFADIDTDKLVEIFKEALAEGHDEDNALSVMEDAAMAMLVMEDATPVAFTKIESVCKNLI